MRAIMILALAGRCSADGRAAGPPPAATGVYVETGEGTSSGAAEPELPRLDLGAWEPWTTSESTGESTGGEGSTTPTDPSGASSSSGETTTTPGTTSGGSTTSGETSTSGGASSGEETSGTTSASESTGEPLTDCECTDGADNTCDLPPGACSATMPGGYCDPNGDLDYSDGDFTLGWQEYQAKCG